jgi:transposase
VRPFVSGNKTDATDARAIWLAVQQPGLKYVGVKTVDQQATLTLHRQRESLMKMRIMQTNALRGLLYEFGATFAKGKKALFCEIAATLEALAGTLAQVVVDSLREQVSRIKTIETDMLTIEKRLKLQLRQGPQMQRIAKIAGVGLLTATAAIATMGDAQAFRSGREFCAWLGLVPKQTGTGGKVILQGISKRGAPSCELCRFTVPGVCWRMLKRQGLGSKQSKRAGLPTWSAWHRRPRLPERSGPSRPSSRNIREATRASGRKPRDARGDCRQ